MSVEKLHFMKQFFIASNFKEKILNKKIIKFGKWKNCSFKRVVSKCDISLTGKFYTEANSYGLVQRKFIPLSGLFF